MEFTFSIVKPDAFAAGNAGAILSMIEAAGFRFAGMRLLQLSKGQAEKFYAVHKERPFYGELTAYMASGPVIVMCLKRENAVLGLRELMGATNPASAAEGTLRKKFGTSIQNNAIHGSDSPENAQKEIAFFFAELELV